MLMVIICLYFVNVCFVNFVEARPGVYPMNSLSLVYQLPLPCKAHSSTANPGSLAKCLTKSKEQKNMPTNILLAFNNMSKKERVPLTPFIQAMILALIQVVVDPYCCK